VNKFTRSSRWRQVFFAACLPYIVVSIFVESLHTGPARQGSASTDSAVAALVAAGLQAPSATLQASAASVLATSDDESCPACNWLRLGRRIENPVGLVRTEDKVLANAPPLIALAPTSPVPHPALFRGPPRPVLS
jgi:hypothetical protein